jgi:hypothetical protein
MKKIFEILIKLYAIAFHKSFSYENQKRSDGKTYRITKDGKTVKQIVIIPADEEEQAKLYERALKSQEEFVKTFPNLQEKYKESIFQGLKNAEENNQKDGDYYILVTELTNLENTYQEFIKNNKELRNYMSEEKIKDLYDKLEKHRALGQPKEKIEIFNDYLKYDVNY